MIASFANVGLVPDGGGLWLLSRMVGLHRAKEMFLFAETLDAQRAHQLGLVREIHPPDQLLPAAMAMAHRFAEGPTRAFGLGKSLAHRAVSSDLETHLELEIAQLVRDRVHVVTRNGVRNLIGFLDRVGRDRRERLLAIPFAAGLRITQPPHDGDELLKRHERAPPLRNLKV